MVCSVWCRAAMDIGQRQPLQEQSCATNAAGTQSQASFNYGEFSRGLMALSSPHASESYVLSVQCYQS
jgi:hypothetical protein